MKLGLGIGTKPARCKLILIILAVFVCAVFYLYPTAWAMQSSTQSREQRSNGGPSNNPLLPVPTSVLEGLQRSTAELWTRVTQSMKSGRVAQGTATLREIVTLDPTDSKARMYLGMALAQTGDRKGAVEQYSKALEAAPASAAIHYNLGAVLTELGSEEEAMGHFRTAIKSDSQLPKAHFQLANLLMRKGQYREAVSEYAAVIAIEPGNRFARLMEAMALIRLKDYSEARSRLERGLSALPDDSDLALTLARLLAACPDSSIRDGRRALELVQQAMKNQKSFDLEQGQTLAMALAAVAQFDKAAQLQRFMIAELERAEQSQLAQQLRANLELYEHNQPCLTPWHDDDPIFVPVPGHLSDATELPGSAASRPDNTTGRKP